MKPPLNLFPSQWLVQVSLPTRIQMQCSAQIPPYYVMYISGSVSVGITYSGSKAYYSPSGCLSGGLGLGGLPSGISSLVYKYTRLNPSGLSMQLASMCLTYDSYYGVGIVEAKAYFPNVINVSNICNKQDVFSPHNY